MSDNDSLSSTASSSSFSESDERTLSQRYRHKNKEPVAKKRPVPEEEFVHEEKKRATGGKKKWTSLEHNGVLFPPDYEPHGVKLLYDGVPVDLTPEQEEAATFFATMLDTDYIKKPTFIKNFWEDFHELLGKRHRIRSFEKIDFSPIHQWHLSEKERKKNLSKEEKKRIKEEKETIEAKYKTAIIDGRTEQVGNFRVEPPGLFRGRGEHPKMGRIKNRIYPRDITINISQDASIPEHPYPDQQWKTITHDSMVTWLAYWKDPINPKDSKYVFLSANSTFKSESDLEKFEKARKLKEHISRIRAEYQSNWTSDDSLKCQMSTALYFIDRLALRAGHEKDEDAADTVGCCNLKVENVECIPPKTIKLDFLGKDSIQYENRVEVDEAVFHNIRQFCEWKAPSAQLFDLFDAQALNKELKSLMDGLSVKVFRTFNASLTLQEHLPENLKDEESIDQKKYEYDAANKKVVAH